MSFDTAPLELSIPVVLAYAWFAGISVVLAVIDLRTHRLPNRIVLPSYAVGIGCLLVASVLGQPWQRFLAALVGMAGLFAFYLALRAVSRTGIGGGDVKLAGLVGLHLGWLGLSPVLLGAIAAFLIGGVVAVVLLATRRATRQTAIPFGPFMLAGAWIAIGTALATSAG